MWCCWTSGCLARTDFRWLKNCVRRPIFPISSFSDSQAMVRPIDPERAMQVGFNALLVKPVDLASLESALAVLPTECDRSVSSLYRLREFV